jgi:hypothetical protein
MQEIEKRNAVDNALSVVGEYVTPTGMVDFKEPADMIKTMMQRVMDSPGDKDLLGALERVCEGGRSIVEFGKAQTEQGNLLVKLLNVNRKLDII